MCVKRDGQGIIRHSEAARIKKSDGSQEAFAISRSGCIVVDMISPHTDLAALLSVRFLRILT